MLTLWRHAHIAAGAVALATFWIPLVSRKGGPLHRRVGLVYAWSMLIVVVAALGAVASRLSADADPAVRSRSIFLAFIALLAFASGWDGLRALRTKKRTGPSSNPLDLGPSLALAIAGPAMILLARPLNGGLLWFVFGVLETVLGVRHLATWRSTPTDKLHWWYQHLAGMIAACIATVTAFLVVNAHRLGLDTLGLTVWIAPGVIGGVGIGVWTAYYRRKFTRPADGAAEG